MKMGRAKEVLGVYEVNDEVGIEFCNGYRKNYNIRLRNIKNFQAMSMDGCMTISSLLIVKPRRLIQINTTS